MEIIVSESAGRNGDKTPDALKSAAASYAWFEPATMQLLEGIVEEAWQELVKSGSPLAGTCPMGVPALIGRPSAG